MHNWDLKGMGVLLDRFIEVSSIRIISGLILIILSSLSLWIMEDIESIYGLISITTIILGIALIVWKIVVSK